MLEAKTQTTEVISHRKNYRVVKQENPLFVGRAPHIRSSRSVASRMWAFVFACLPVVLGAVIHFGVQPLWVLFHCAVSALVFEFAAEKIFKRPVRIWDGSALLIGLLLGLNLPDMAPWWLCWTGSFFAVFVARELCGGLAQNRFQPVFFGLAVLLFLFPVPLLHHESLASGVFSRLAVLASAIFLISRKLIRWQNTLTYLTAVCALGLIGGQNFQEIFSGAILFTAVFILTDSVTSPLTVSGGIVFAAIAGLLTEGIRIFIGYPEGMIFGVLLMNGFTPLIDKYVRIKPVSLRA